MKRQRSSASVVRQLRSSIIAACLFRNISNPADMRDVIGAAMAGIRKMRVAGVKAAMTKGQI